MLKKRNKSLCCGFLLLLFLQASLNAQVLLPDRQELVPGEALIALVYPQPEANSIITLTLPGGETLECPGSPHPVQGYGKGLLFFVPVAPDSPSGKATLRWEDQSVEVLVKHRSFGHLNIPLSEDPQPQAAGDNLLYRQLGRFNADQKYWNGAAFPLPLSSYKLISSPYGERRTFTRAGRSWNEIHQGIDYAHDRGIPCYAPTAGRVVMSDHLSSPGNLVVLEFFPGMYQLFYHLDSRAVNRGDMVEQGELIGRVGSTGKSTGPHLHFEVRIHNIYVDPQFFLDGLYNLEEILPSMVQTQILGTP